MPSEPTVPRHHFPPARPAQLAGRQLLVAVFFLCMLLCAAALLREDTKDDGGSVLTRGSFRWKKGRFCSALRRFGPAQCDFTAGVVKGKGKSGLRILKQPFGRRGVLTNSFRTVPVSGCENRCDRVLSERCKGAT